MTSLIPTYGEMYKRTEQLLRAMAQKEGWSFTDIQSQAARTRCSSLTQEILDKLVQEEREGQPSA